MTKLLSCLPAVIQTHFHGLGSTGPASSFVNVLLYDEDGVFVWLCARARRLHNAVQAKQKDKQAVGQLEKRLKAEQEARTAAEKQLADEKKRKKLEEATAARAVALAAASR